MLKDNFYKIAGIVTGEKNILNIRLNRDHPIFEGHFPGNPIVPGVCLIQMIHETMEYLTGNKLILKSGDNLKFISIINPLVDPDIKLSVSFKLKEERGFQVEALFLNDDKSFFSFKGSFRIEDSL